MKLSPSRKKQSGSVILLTVFLLIILSLIGTAFIALLPVEMRSAQHERIALQSNLGAEAGIQSVMVDLREGVAYDDIPTGVEVSLGDNWSYTVERVERLGKELYRVTSVGLYRGKVQRRAVAMIDDASGTPAIKNTSATVDGRSVGAWPATIPVKGDVLWMGTWTLDNSSPFNMNQAGNPPIQGTVYHTQPDTSSSALRQERYTSGNPSAAQYPNIYSRSLNAIKPAPRLAEGDLLNSTSSQEKLLQRVFDLSDGPSSVTAANAVTNSVKVTASGGRLTGGIFINDNNGNQNSNNNPGRKFDVRFTAPSPGIGVTTFERQDGVKTTITTIKAGAPLPVGVAGPSVSSSDRISVISNGSPPTTELLETDITTGHVIYVDGEVASMQGTYRGAQTIAVKQDVAITGELLKADTPRGEEPTAASGDSLGIAGTLKAPNNSVGTNIKITNQTYPRPADNTYYVYAYLTGLDGNDTNNKLFKDSAIPSGTKIHLMGSLQLAPSNSGLMGQTMDFIESAFKQVTVDPVQPPEWLGTDGFIPRVRAYVDVPVSH